MIDLSLKPFFLNSEDIKWVEDTLAGMTDEEKIAQLFCLIAYTSDAETIKDIAVNKQPGGLMCRTMPASETVETVSILQTHSKIPMLIAANLEKGGNGIISDGTLFGSPMEVGATDDDEMATKLGTVCGREGSAVGCNWSFAPIIDIDYNFRNPITNTRTFGSDPERVKRMGVNYIKEIQRHGIAASAKHFPGDGVDERDQHLVTSINPLSCGDWDRTYGEVYKACIEAGVMTVMIGHIMLPEYSRYFNPNIKDEDILPASLSYDLVTKLLKEQLGFNGLVVTDATVMAGMTIPMPREKAVPLTIAAGCDMFLFTRNQEEDYEYMKRGIDDGTISKERLNDALTKILGLKAALKLHKKKADCSITSELSGNVCPVQKGEHEEWAQQCADKAITLVKEEKGVLPVTTQKYKKILLYPLENEQVVSVYTVHSDASAVFKKLLENEGFVVDVSDASKAAEGAMKPYRSMKESYDLIIYFANLSTKSNQTVVRIEWAMPFGANVPIHMTSVPTIFISVENPYHLIDVPCVKTFINTYASSDIVLKTLVDKLTGKSEFKGVSPVDPFCGMWDTKL